MNCPHTTTRIILTPELTHHGKIACTACGKFMGWAKKPENIEREARHAVLIVRLRADARLAAKEREFIVSLDGQGLKRTPPQQAWLEALGAKYV